MSEKLDSSSYGRRSLDKIIADYSPHNDELDPDTVAAANRVVDAQNAVIQKATERDQLTGLYNKHAWLRKVNERLSEAKPTSSYAVVFIDLNNFKAINDRISHNKGDEVLKDFSILLTSNTRQKEDQEDILLNMNRNDDPARLGGDEFAVFIDLGSSTPDEGIKVFQNRLNTVFQEYLTSHPELQEHKFGYSFGSVMWAEGQTAEDMLDKADQMQKLDKDTNKALNGSYR